MRGTVSSVRTGFFNDVEFHELGGVMFPADIHPLGDITIG